MLKYILKSCKILQNDDTFEGGGIFILTLGAIYK
jgi:hypothetical protein